MQKKIFSRGFTLIELLVVIAIIGILASVVLASLNSARSKGADAAIQSSINNMRAQAELFYDDTGTYDGLCTAVDTDNNGSTVTSGDDTVAEAVSNVDNTNGSGTVRCNASGNTYAVASQLVSDNGDYYCVDSTGQSSTITGTIIGTGVYACP